MKYECGGLLNTISCVEVTDLFVSNVITQCDII